MDLKDLLGEELFNQISAKLEGHKVIINDDGAYIPKARFDELTEQKNGYKTQVEQLNTELTGLKKTVKDNEGATSKIAELQDAIKNKETENLTIQKKYALREELTKAGSKYPDLLESKIDLSKIELENGKVKDADNLIKPYKESYKELFGEVIVKGTDVKDGKNPDTKPTPPKTVFEAIGQALQAKTTK